MTVFHLSANCHSERIEARMTIEAKIPAKPSQTEKLLSFGILSLLAFIAAGIFTVQSDYNPAVVQLYTEPATSGQSLPPTSAVAAAIIPLPTGISALTPPETFESRTLSDKINGKAELYLSAGFKRLQSQRFGDDSASDRWYEILVFDMATQENAFAVYSSQQREDGVPVDLGPYAYRTANAFFWVHGPYYLELIAAEDSEDARKSMRRIAESFNQTTAVDTQTVTETDLFPPDGLDRKSITLIPADAFGLEKFDRVLVADYTVGGTLLSAFFSNRGAPQAAKQQAEDYRKFLIAFGGKSVETQGLYIVEILDAYEIIFTHGPYIAGIHEATDRDRALVLARSLQASIEDAIGKQKKTRK
jgi:hypothetical protein